MSNSHLKHDAKISAQSSQIQNLHNKLDAAVVENSQMHEYLHPSTLQTTVTNVLQAVQGNLHVFMGGCVVSHQGRVSLSWVNPESLSSQRVRMGPQILTRLAGTARILGMS